MAINNPSFISNILVTLRTRVTLRNVLSGMSWMFFDRFARYALGFLVGAWIARLLGPEQFGTLSFVFAISAIFMPFLASGLDPIAIKALAKQTSRSNEILGSLALLKLLGSIILIVLSLCATSFLRPEQPEVLYLVLITSVCTLFFSVDVIEVWFQSQLKPKYAIIGKGFSFILFLCVKIVLVVRGSSILSFVWSGALEVVIGALGLVILFQLKGGRVNLFGVDKEWFSRMLLAGLPLILASFSSVICVRVDQLIISRYIGDSELGIYNAAFRFSEFAYSLPALAVTALFPVLINLKSRDHKEYLNRLQQFFDSMLLVSIGIAAVISIGAGFIITTFYGPAFTKATVLLGIHIWSIIFVFQTVASNQDFIVEGRTLICLIRTIAGAIINIALNFWLVPRIGSIGAAYVAVISNAGAAYFIFLLPGCRHNGMMMLKSFQVWRLLSTYHLLTKAGRNHDR